MSRKYPLSHLYKCSWPMLAVNQLSISSNFTTILLMHSNIFNIPGVLHSNPIMAYPKALRGDDEYAEIRPKRMDIQTSKITPTNPLSFADKSAQAVGPSRGFEPPPQAMELPPWETPISPAAHADFPYPAKGIGPPQAVLDHPMKAKGYMKHAEKVKRDLEDMQVCMCRIFLRGSLI